LGAANPAATAEAFSSAQPEANQAPTEAPAALSAQPAEQPKAPFYLPPIRIGEILLALVALGAGLAAFFLRRV
jgi:hypothetical protein